MLGKFSLPESSLPESSLPESIARTVRRLPDCAWKRSYEDVRDPTRGGGFPGSVCRAPRPVHTLPVAR